MMTSAHAVAGTPDAGHFSDAGETASGLARYVGRGVGAIFALILLDASIIGACAVTLATSYAFGDVFGLRHSLHRSIRDAKVFYGSYSAMISLAAGIVLIPNAPLGLMTTAVQALAGILLPSATIFLLLLCNDPAVLGPWVNRAWLNVVASIIVGLLLELSLVLVIATLIPSIDVGRVFVVLSIALAAGLAAAGAVILRGRRLRPAEPADMRGVDRLNWRMPPLALLERPRWSRGPLVAMYALRGDLVVAVIPLIVKAVQLATAH
jgi:hypothetical protein